MPNARGRQVCSRLRIFLSPIKPRPVQPGWLRATPRRTSNTLAPLRREIVGAMRQRGRPRASARGKRMAAPSQQGRATSGRVQPCRPSAGRRLYRAGNGRCSSGIARQSSGEAQRPRVGLLIEEVQIGCAPRREDLHFFTAGAEPPTGSRSAGLPNPSDRRGVSLINTLKGRRRPTY